MSKFLKGSSEKFTSRPSQSWNDGQVTEIVSELSIERRRDPMSRYEREFSEYETTSVKGSRNSQATTAKSSPPEEANEPKTIVPKISSPDDDLDGPYSFQVVPPTPNNPAATMSEKQDAPKEGKSTLLQWGGQ